MAAQHLIQDAPGAVNIRPRVGTAARHLLRRHIGWGADHRSTGGAGQGLFIVSRLSDPTDPLGHSEIEDLETVVTPHHEVRWLDIAVDDAEGVGSRQRLGQLDPEIDDSLRGAGTVAHEFFEALAIDKLRCKEQLRLVVTFGYGLAGFEQSGHALVVNGRCEASLTQKAVANLLISCDFGSNELERDLPLQHLVARTVDNSHPARSEPLEELEVCDSALTFRATGSVPV